MKISLKNKVYFEFSEGITLLEIAKSFFKDDWKSYIVAGVDSKLTSLSEKLDHDAELEFFTIDSEEGKNTAFHSAVHVLGQAILRIFPTAKMGTHKSTKTGFYIDFDFITPITPEEFPLIEAEIKRIIKEDLPIVHKTYTEKGALRLVRILEQPYLEEIIRDRAEGDDISIFRQGDFLDVCDGPHLPRTGYLQGVHITGVTGAHWKNQKTQKMLTRISAKLTKIN